MANKIKLNNSKGFNVVELMVAVVMVGIIAAIAVPAYQDFQSKARQKQGIKLLQGYYTSAQSAFAEFGLYPGNFVQTGFRPSGELMYRLRAEDSDDAPVPINDDGCWRTPEPCDCGGACPTFKTWQELPRGIVGERIGIAAVLTGTLQPCGGLGALGVSNSPPQFSIRVSGIISLSAMDKDEWGIDQNKTVFNCLPGL